MHTQCLVLPYLAWSFALTLPIAHTLVRPDFRFGRCAAEYACHGAFHGRHDYVFGLDLSARVGSAAVQVHGAGYAVGRAVFDWRVGCAGGEGEAEFGGVEWEVEIERRGSEMYGYVVN
jgi:hypothetical protein